MGSLFFYALVWRVSSCCCLVDRGRHGGFRRCTASFIGVWAGGANLVARAVRIGVGDAVHHEKAVDFRLIKRSGCPARYECYFHDFFSTE